MARKTNAQLVSELEELKQRELRYRVLLDDSSDPIFSFNEEGRYLYVNRQFAAGLDGDLTQEEIVGKTIWDFFPKEGADARFAIVKEVFDTGLAKNIEVMVPRAAGDTYYLTTAKPIFGENDEVDYVICISKDITKRRQREAELKKRTEELEKALKEINELRGIVPICSYCKKTRNDKGYWDNVENYINTHTGAELSHGICPDCLPKAYEDMGVKAPEKKG